MCKLHPEKVPMIQPTRVIILTLRRTIAASDKKRHNTQTMIIRFLRCAQICVINEIIVVPSLVIESWRRSLRHN